MKVNSILAKLVFIAAVIGILAFVAVTPSIVRAFFVGNSATDIVSAVFHRQPVQAPQAVQPAQPVKPISASSSYQQNAAPLAASQAGSSQAAQAAALPGAASQAAASQADASQTIRPSLSLDDEPEHMITGTLGTKVEFTGTITAMNGSTWMVDTTTVMITSTTELEGTFAVGSKVKVEGFKQTDGTVIAREISTYNLPTGGGKQHHGKEVEFTGAIMSMTGNTWVVGAWTVIISPTTELKGTFAVGTLVKVEGFKQDDGSVLAKEIKVAKQSEGEHEKIKFTGAIMSMTGNTWVVGTTTVVISPTTEMSGTFSVGMKVVVVGFKQPDGSVLATQIKAAEDEGQNEEKEGKGIEFVAVLTATNGSSWTVGAYTVIISDKTHFEGTPKVGDKIRVAGKLQADGTVLANNIKVVTHDKGAGGNPGGNDNKGGNDHKGGNDNKGGNDHKGGGGSGGGNGGGGGHKGGKGGDD